MLIENRKKSYKGLNNYTDNSLPGLVYFYNADFTLLKDAIQTYLEKTLSIWYNKPYVIRTDKQLHNSIKDIMGLPNLTPNGNIIPKKETAKYYTKIQQEVNNCLKQLNIFHKIDKFVCTNIMVKFPINDSKILNRPHYTGKMHSDAWPGHVGDAIMMAGILGDIEGSTVEYFKPINPHDNFLELASSYDEGNTRYDDIEYIGKMVSNKFVVMDQACLHRTKFLNNSKTRVSINFGALMMNSINKDIATTKRWEDSYFSNSMFDKLGTDYVLEVDETLQECHDKYKSNSNAIQLPNNGIYFKKI